MTLRSQLARAANSILLRPLGVKLVRSDQALAVASGPVNNGAFWDRYVLDWEASEENRALPRVGNEWKNEEIFLSLLKKYSSPERTALEIGCGGGRITSSAVEWFKHVHAGDVSREMLRKNREGLLHTNVSFHLLDGFTLGEFADESLDCVYSHDVFVHFSSLQVYPYLAEIKRVLKRGGVAVLSFYNLPVHFELFKTMSQQFARAHVYPPHMRVHFVTEEMITLMLQDLSLKVEETDRTNFLIPVIRR